MEFLPNGSTLNIPPECFPLGTDSMILAHFVRLPRRARVIDLGSGCGTLGMMLCAKDALCHVTGIEIDARAHEAACENIARNALSARMESIHADIRALPCPAGSFSVCISNPPYFSAGPASVRTPTARREDACSAAELMRSAAHALKYGGDLFLVHRPERLADLIAKASVHALEAKRLLLVRHRPDAPPSIIALQFRKGGKAGLTIEEATLWASDGTPTDFYRSVYHL